MFRSALLILSGNAAASVLLLARNLIVARLISVEDYGVAATFAIAMAVVEMMSSLGLQQQIVQSTQGDDPRFQAGLQGFQVLRGVIAGAILFLSAGVIADFLGIPEVAWAYQVMALMPVFNALQHFDIHRLNRQMRFWPVILTGAVPALISLAAIWPLYHLFGDYQVMLWAIIVQIGFMLVVSHLVAERPYRLVLDPTIMAGSLKFGWPLLVNGLLLFAVFNGDKLIVGRALGMETLAIFAMGITLTLTPTLVMAKSAQNFFLPQLSALEDKSSGRFAALANVTVEASLLMGILLVVGTALLGQTVVWILLGAKYAALLPLITWFAVMQAARVFKAGPAIVAMAAGHNDSAMFANLVRVLALPLAWYVATTSGDLTSLIFIGIIAELVSYGTAIALLKLRTGVALGGMFWSHVGAAFALGAASMQAWLLSQTTTPSSAFVLGSSAVVVLCALLSIWCLPALRGYITTKGKGVEA